jgi:hypothetical protein
MTPESIPGRLVPEDLFLLFLLPYLQEPPHSDHEVLFTDLPKAA